MLQAEEWSTAVHGFAVFPMHRGSGLTARYPCPRQKKPIPFRFPGLRKHRESCISIGSFFLSSTDPLCWALCLWGEFILSRER